MLEVNYAGLRLKNPIIVASATPSMSLDGLKKANDSGAGAVIIKSVVFPKKYLKNMEYVEGRATGLKPSPRFLLLNQGETYNSSLTDKRAYFTLFRVGEPYLKPDEAAEMIERGKKDIDIPIIGSVAGAVDDYEEWKKLARIMEDSGADAIELNLHCIPVVKYTNSKIVRAVRQAVAIPVIAKLMCAWENPESIGPELENAGASAITAVGTFGMPVMELDVETPRILLQPSYYGAGGPWLRPVGLAFVSKLAKVVKIPISGVTGVVSWQDAVKYILVGATTVQVCAAIYAKGYKVLGEITQGIEEFMERKGYRKIQDFKGFLQKDILPREHLEYDPPIRALVDEDLCDGCGDCRESCFFEAITVEDDLARIEAERCDGCGLCVSICPLRAITMRKVY